MAGTSHGSLMLMSAMPLLGLGILAVVLLAMALNRDRWIVPGSIAVILAASGWAAAMEYGPQARELLARSMAPAPARVAATSPAAPRPETNENAGGPEPAPAPAVAETTRPGRERSKPAERRPALVPREETRRELVPDERETTRDGRRTVVVNPVAKPREPAPRPAEAPRSTPAPAPRPVVTVPAAPPASPPPVATIARATPAPSPPAPALQPTPAPAAGRGTLVVTIHGPLVETAQTAAREPHVLAILDGKMVEIAAPTRVTENHQNDDPKAPLLAYTYFWENVTFTFSNLDAGWHVVMLDTALDNPGAHQARMTGSGQDQNDYNGAVEIKAGKTTYMEFGAKNFMTGKLPNPRIR